MKIDQFRKVQEYRELGLSQKKTAEKLKLTLFEVRKVWVITEEEYYKLSKQTERSLDAYREYILSVLKLSPQIKEANLYYKLQENFPEFDSNKITFYRYMKKLRQETGYDVYKDKDRLRTMREKPQPGYEAQVDFGQYKMKDMYGINRRIYFFVMVLSFSNLRFAYFNAEPFTTATAIQAHKYAFRFLGGRPQTVLYDQDRVFVVSENLGNILFVQEFEEYVKNIGYSIILCKPYDPQTKGRVEQAVRFIKERFLDGRTYCGIDCLNSACLEWLDKNGNAVVSATTGKTAHDLFREEAKHMVKIPYVLNPSCSLYTVQKMNSLRYHANDYELPKGMFQPGDTVEAKEIDGKLIILLPESGEFVCEHMIPNGTGQTVKLKDKVQIDSVGLAVISKRFSGNEPMLNFVSIMQANQPRYYLKGCARLWKMTNYYTDTQLTEAAEYCLRVEKCNMSEFTSYLVYRHGAEIAKNFAYQSLLFNYKQRAKEMQEELNGHN